MKIETYHSFKWFLLGAACVLSVLMFADTYKRKERSERQMAIVKLRMAHDKRMPYDIEKYNQFSEQMRAIDREKDADPLIIQCSFPLIMILILIIGRLEHRSKNRF